ncbi:MAG TPA: class I SAM-dependent methyltransferase [Aliidongia sp.]|nr:class I SAM-dependent methyltransferase [Aliidongia sp.]
MSSEAADWRAKNLAMWDGKVPAHLKSVLYDVPRFIAGGLSLKPHEIADLPDAAGKDLVHLQCHIGLDTLSWARLGAHVTGLDFSPAAIAAAGRIAHEAGLKARFVTADVYDAPAALGQRYDIVYTGVGALCWLPDLVRWAEAVGRLLRPGGLLYLFEFHPVEWMFDDGADGGLALTVDYFTPAGGHGDFGAVSYAAADAGDPGQPTVSWNHPLGEVVTALIGAGLHIEELRELDRAVVARWKAMEPTEDGMFRMAAGMPRLPLMYVLKARRPG